MRGASYGDRARRPRRRARQPRRAPRPARALRAARRPRLPRPRHHSPGTTSTPTWCCAAAPGWSSSGSTGSTSTSPRARRPRTRHDRARRTPTCSRRSRSAPLTLRNRVVMGSMHTGLEDRAWDLPKLAAYFAERARGGVGLIVTGGYAPNKRGWLKPFASEMTTPAAGDAAPRRHRRGPRRGRRDRPPGAARGPLRLPPVQRQRVGPEVPDHALQAVRPVHEGRRTTPSTAFAESVALAQQGGVRRGRDHGLGGLPDQPVPRRPHQRPHRRVGRHARPTGCASPSRSCAAPASWSATDFPIMYRISLLDLVEDGQTWEETLELAHRLEEAGVTVFNTGIGWHEARVPTIITQVPRGAWRSATARLKAEVSVPGLRLQPDQHPRGGRGDPRRRARPTWSRWPGRCWPTPSSWPRPPPGAPTRSTPASRCNQACLDHVFGNEQASCLVNPRACRETTLVLHPARRSRPHASRSSAPDRPAWRPRSRPRSVASRSPCSRRADAIGGQFRLAMHVPGKEEFAETLRYYRRRLEVLGVDVRLSTAATADRPRVVRRGGRRHRRGAAGPRPATASTTRAWCRTPTCSAAPSSPGRRVAVLGAGGIGVDVAHFLSPRPGRDASRTGWRTGASATRRVHPGGLTEPKPRVSPARGDPAAAQDHPDRHRPRQDLRLGAPRGAPAGRRPPGPRRDLRPGRRRGPARHRRRRPRRCWPSTTSCVCAGQESVRGLYDELAGAAATRRPHLIGGADVAAELDAKRAIEQGTRVAAAL